VYKAVLTPNQRVIVAKLFDAFVDRDYPECATQVFDLGMTLGFRYFTFILSMGINFDIDNEPSLQANLIYTIAHLRLGEYIDAEGVLNLHSFHGSVAWATRLVSISLRKTSLGDELEHAQTDVQRLQAHYYEAEGRITDRKFEAAAQMFKRCLELPGNCPERGLRPCASSLAGALRTPILSHHEAITNSHLSQSVPPQFDRGAAIKFVSG